MPWQKLQSTELLTLLKLALTVILMLSFYLSGNSAIDYVIQNIVTTKTVPELLDFVTENNRTVSLIGFLISSSFYLFYTRLRSENLMTNVSQFEMGYPK